MKSEQIRVDILLFVDTGNTMFKFIQILLNSDLKASMRVENLTQYDYPTAPDKKCKWS